MKNKELWFTRDQYTQNLSIKKKIKLHLWFIIDSLLFKTSFHFLSAWRIFLLRLFGAKIGKGCFISPKATIYVPWNFTMGNHSSIDDYSYIETLGEVIIGDYVSISNYVHIIPAGHDVRKRNFASIVNTIIINHGAFIGSRSYIHQGVTIGQMAVIGANSFVLKNIPENSIAYGNPCKIYEERISIEEYNSYRYNL